MGSTWPTTDSAPPEAHRGAWRNTSHPASSSAVRTSRYFFGAVSNARDRHGHPRSQQLRWRPALHKGALSPEQIVRRWAPTRPPERQRVCQRLAARLGDRAIVGQAREYSGGALTDSASARAAGFNTFDVRLFGVGRACGRDRIRHRGRRSAIRPPGRRADGRAAEISYPARPVDLIAWFSERYPDVGVQGGLLQRQAAVAAGRPVGAGELVAMLVEELDHGQEAVAGQARVRELCLPREVLLGPYGFRQRPGVQADEGVPTGPGCSSGPSPFLSRPRRSGISSIAGHGSV
jgi:hypothetical protein